MISHLTQALGLEKASSVAIVGAGGKTSVLFRLARSLPGPVFLANSAHLGSEQAAYADQALAIAHSGDLPDFAGGVPEGVTLFHGPEIPQRKRLNGLDEASLDLLQRLAGYHDVPLLIEADGARGWALKAPAEHEPPIPGFVRAVVMCAGLGGLGKPIEDGIVFRPERFAALSGLPVGLPVSSEGLAEVLTDPQGGLKNIPPGAKRLLLLNQADTPELQASAAQIARMALPSYSGVVVASLHGPGPQPEAQIHAAYHLTAGILLAAGGSQRMGRSKQLLEWQGEALVRRAARAGLEAGLDPLVVVSGAEGDAVCAALKDLRVVTVHCQEWEAGQSASLKAGLRKALELRPDLGGALFLLSDQPYADAGLMQAVMDLRARTLSPVCAPRAGGRRANPVLFGRETFGRLLSLEGDAGGRQVIAEFRVEMVDWPDERILEDIDTIEDFRRLTNSKSAGEDLTG